MVILIILISLLSLALLILIIISCLLARYVARPSIITIPEEIKFEKEHGMWKNYDDLKKEEYLLKSYDGYELNCIYVPADDTSNKYVIISHGYSGCRLGSVKYLHLFRSLGFNAFMYDDRGHGSNKKAPCTMGFKESRDLIAVIDHVYNRFGSDIILGLHGESMGSGLTNNAIQYNPKVAFIVSDCGYSNLEKLLADLVKKNLHLPAFFAKTAGIASSVIYGYNFKKVMPITHVQGTSIPICFIHGEADSFIICDHAKAMYEASQKAIKETGIGYSELHIVPNAPHAASVITDEDGYQKIVTDFLKKVLPEA